MDLLHDKIGTSLAMNSPERISSQFVDIWSLTSSAQTNVSQLPLSLLPFHKTNEFLSSISDFTYQTAIRDLDDSPLTDEELKKLEHYYEQAAHIKDELRQAQHLALTNNLRWMDVELALVSSDERAENSIIDGFQTVENTMGEFTDGTVGAELIKPKEKKYAFKHITGENKSEQDIMDISKKMFNLENQEDISITKSGPGSKVPNYNVSYHTASENVFMDITEKGAHPVTILVERPVEEKKISLNDGLLKAEAYLKKFDYTDMQMVESKQFGNVGMFTFLYMLDGVKVYPDKITVKVALDNGDILGLNATEYLKNHRERTIDKPTLSKVEARRFVNEKVEIQEQHLAVIENNIQEEVLTYAMLGVLGEETYRIFINAFDGAEERVEKLTGTETNFDTNL